MTRYSVYDASGTLIEIDEVGGPKTDYIRASGMTLARITGSTVTWLHHDHLGSAVAGTNSTGAVVWRESEQPFGEDWTTAAANDNQAGYTFHVEDAATGLTYMQARYYDPVIGRFLSIDPVGFSPGRPDMFNRFAYAANDPVNMVDPDGRDRRVDTVTVTGFRRGEFDALAWIARLALSYVGKKVEGVARALPKRISEQAEMEACKFPEGTAIGVSGGQEAYLPAGGGYQIGASIDPRTGQGSVFGSVVVGAGASRAPVPVPLPVTPVASGTASLNAPNGITGNIIVGTSFARGPVGASYSKSVIGSNAGDEGVEIYKAATGISGNLFAGGEGSLPLTPKFYNVNCDEDD